MRISYGPCASKQLSYALAVDFNWNRPPIASLSKPYTDVKGSEKLTFEPFGECFNMELIVTTPSGARRPTTSYQ